MNVYEGIEFAKDYNKSFAEFKDDFGSNHIFNNFQPKERELKLKAAYKIATSNGHTSRAIIESEEDSAK